VDCLLTPAGIPTLKDLLDYHVVTGSTVAKDLKDDQKLTTLDNKLKLDVKKSDGTVTVNGATVIKADVLATNGVVHEIDKVLIPAGFDATATLKLCAGTTTTTTAKDGVTQTIADLAVATPELSTLVAALKAAKLVAVFNGTDPFTVFAPSNDAFNELQKGLVDCLLTPAGIPTLKDLLDYHVVTGSTVAKDLKDDQKLTTLDNKLKLDVKKSDGTVTVNGATVIKADVLATNGVVHEIDKVLIPAGFDATATLNLCGGPSSDPLGVQV